MWKIRRVNHKRNTVHNQSATPCLEYGYRTYVEVQGDRGTDGAAEVHGQDALEKVSISKNKTDWRLQL